MDFPRFLVLPVPPLLERPVELDGAWTRTIICTATAIPAFFRVQDNGRFTLLRMRYIDIYLACFYTNVAPVADIRIEYYRLVRCGNIRNSEYVFLSHFILQKQNWFKRQQNPPGSVISPYKLLCNLCCEIHTVVSYRPKISVAVPRS